MNMQESENTLLKEIKKLNIPSLSFKLKAPTSRSQEVQDVVEEVDGIYFVIIKTLSSTHWASSQNKVIFREVERMILALDTFLAGVTTLYPSDQLTDDVLKDEMLKGLEVIKLEWIKSKEICNIEEHKCFNN